MALKTVKHQDRAHALLSASGSSRWLNCTPSAKLEDLEPQISSVYADEGTLAHEISELMLKNYQQKISQKEYAQALNQFKQHKLYNPEMDDYCEQYIEYVISQHVEFLTQGHENAILLVEQKLDLTKYIAESFGTVDAVLLANRTLEIIDLKYGKGVKVDAYENSQLKLYALGAIEAYQFLDDFDTVKVTIVQPRMDNISSQVFQVEDLVNWGETYVKVQADLATQGIGEFTAGSWCKFCKIQYKCPAMGTMANELAATDFDDAVSVLDDSSILDLYKKADLVAAFIGSIKKFVFNEALKGKSWPGYKLVEGKSNRKVIDEDALIANVLTHRKTITLDELVNTKLKSFADLTKVLGKTSFDGLVVPFLEKPTGAPTLVSESDTRPAWSSAANDFADSLESFDLDF